MFKFLSTPSGWRATAGPLYHAARRVDFYPRPPGGGRQREDKIVRLAQQISIHALRVEGDPGAAGGSASKRGFLSTPSGWRATCFSHPRLFVCPLFLSTPSGWRATYLIYSTVFRQNDFYPRPPGGGRLRCRIIMRTMTYFYPRPPGGGRHDELTFLEKGEWRISIHALRVEGDPHFLPHDRFGSRNFYPRPPGGGRLGKRHLKMSITRDFYPRPPGGGRRCQLPHVDECF